MIIKMTAKCSDGFSATLYNKQGKQIGRDYDGYVPNLFPLVPGQEVHDGDYVELDIDTDNGKILHWKKISNKKLKEIFKF